MSELMDLQQENKELKLQLLTQVGELQTMSEEKEALKAMVAALEVQQEELQSFLSRVGNDPDEDWFDAIQLLEKTPSQSLHDNNMAVAERVRDYILNHYIVYLDMEKVVYAEAIRTLDLSSVVKGGEK
jgi:hypothetical protein